MSKTLTARLCYKVPAFFFDFSPKRMACASIVGHIPFFKTSPKRMGTASAKKKYMVICDDNIYIVPDKDEYKDILLVYALEKSAYLWWQDYEKRNPPPPEKASAKAIRSLKSVFSRDTGVEVLKKIGLYKIARKIYRMMKG